MTLQIEHLNKSVHALDSFSNEEEEIEHFLKLRAEIEYDQNLSETHVLVNDEQRNIILGYFTLSPNSIRVNKIPEGIRPNAPYPNVPTTLLGRMGRNKLAPKGLGIILMKEAMRISLNGIRFFALELHAKNDQLVKYYSRYGFMLLQGSNRPMILPYQEVYDTVMN